MALNAQNGDFDRSNGSLYAFASTRVKSGPRAPAMQVWFSLPGFAILGHAPRLHPATGDEHCNQHCWYRDHENPHACAGDTANPSIFRCGYAENFSESLKQQIVTSALAPMARS
jgi:hypothetical protein